MAYIKMIPVTPNPAFPRGTYKASESLSAPGNGQWIIIEPGIQQINVDLLITAGEGRIESTNDYEGAIAGTAVGIAWDAGNVSTSTQGSAFGVAAIRVVNISGTTKVIVNGVI